MELLEVIRDFERITRQFVKQCQQRDSQLPGICCSIDVGCITQCIGQYQFPGGLVQDGVCYGALARQPRLQLINGRAQQRLVAALPGLFEQFCAQCGDALFGCDQYLAATQVRQGCLVVVEDLLRRNRERILAVGDQG